MKVVKSWQGESFYGAATMLSKDELVCAREIDGVECGGRLHHISPNTLQCEKCLIVNVLEKVD